ncbi:ankyrin repeat-containing protein [Penicillium canescens]|nr:ankyrin repeat-containing protein [Penicillium canescens]
MSRILFGIRLVVKPEEDLLVDAKDDENLLAQLSSYDHEIVHRRLSRKRLTGTTQWFKDHPQFKAWFIEKSFSCLWCSGKSKTMIASVTLCSALPDPTT